MIIYKLIALVRILDRRMSDNLYEHGLYELGKKIALSKSHGGAAGGRS
jgi:hypothetical protein